MVYLVTISSNFQGSKITSFRLVYFIQRLGVYTWLYACGVIICITEEIHKKKIGMVLLSYMHNITWALVWVQEMAQKHGKSVNSATADERLTTYHGKSRHGMGTRIMNIKSTVHCVVACETCILILCGGMWDLDTEIVWMPMRHGCWLRLTCPIS